MIRLTLYTTSKTYVSWEGLYQFPNNLEKELMRKELATA